MDHQEEHHLHHRKEREEKKEKRKEHEHEQEKLPGPAIHPTWFWVLGLVLTLVAVLVWTFFL